MSSAEPLVTLLADGALHSGERLAEALGVSRTAVWKVVTDLRERGIPVLSVDRRGYKLEHPVELLQLAHLRAAAARRQRDLPAATEVIFELGSTNEYLHAAAAPPPGQPRARVRRTADGRPWSPWPLVARTFRRRRDVLDRLVFRGHAGGPFRAQPGDGRVRCAGAARHGAPRIMLKWPNDIVFEHRKLGGLLAQLRVEAGGPAYVVIGLGLNLQLPRSTRSALIAPSITPVADLAEAWAGRSQRRNEVAARVASAMLDGLAHFARSGFAPFAAEWATLDSLRDAPVTVVRHDGALRGRCARSRCRRRVAPRHRRRDLARARRRGEPAARRIPGGTRAVMLLVDIGNTRVKWATLEAGLMSPQRAESHAQWDGSAVARCTCLRQARSTRVIAASVAGSTSRVHLEQAAAASGITVQFVASSTQAAGVTQCLCRSEPARSRSLAGRDRRLSLAAQRVLRRRRGYGGHDRCGRRTMARHLGGFIVPGPQLMVAQPALRYERSRSAHGTQHARDEHVVREQYARRDRARLQGCARGARGPGIPGVGGSRHDATCVVGHRRRDRANRAVHKWPPCSRARAGLAWSCYAGAGSHLNRNLGWGSNAQGRERTAHLKNQIRCNCCRACCKRE